MAKNTKTEAAKVRVADAPAVEVAPKGAKAAKAPKEPKAARAQVADAPAVEAVLTILTEAGKIAADYDHAANELGVIASLRQTGHQVSAASFVSAATRRDGVTVDLTYSAQ